MLESEYQKKDTVRKYQFEDYNKSLCMSNMYPEVAPDNSVIVAPGEVKVPQNVLYANDWDMKAFPQWQICITLSKGNKTKRSLLLHTENP